MIDRSNLLDKIWACIDCEENSDAAWYEDADVLFDIFSSLCLTAKEYHCISESEMCAFLDYKKEQMRRRVFGIEDKTKKGKQKDFGPDKKDLR